MSSRSKRQTMAKMTRERLVKERRALKLEKKQAAAAARKAGDDPFAALYAERTAGIETPEDAVDPALAATDGDAETSADS
jgi:hypothetical protein